SRYLVGRAGHGTLHPFPTRRSSDLSRATSPRRGASTFRVEEATIADLHRAIQQGETTCKAIVQAYIERARAYNGTCTQLVTRDRSEEHTSELQSRGHLVCRLLLEKK